MKTNIGTVLLTICVVFSISAQSNRKQHSKPEFTVEQQTTLFLKKMTLSLDLSEKQQGKMKPLLAEIVMKKNEMMEAKKANNGQKPELSSEEAFAKLNEKLDYQIALQNKMKSVLDEDQFEKYQEMRARMEKSKKAHSSKGSHGRKGGHKGKNGQKGQAVMESEA